MTGEPAVEDPGPVPNPPPVPGDYLPSRVVTAPGALRRSLIVWGWGQLSAGDRRWVAGPAAQLASIGLLVVAAPYAIGTTAPLVFLLGAAVLALWAGVAAHAWHRAARRRAALGASPAGGAGGLLWLTPLVVVLGAGFWVAAGRGADAGLTLDAYLGDWQAGRTTATAPELATAADPVALGEAWTAQSTALRNALVRVTAGDPDAAADLDRPLEGLRWVDAGPAPDGGRRFALEVVRQETIRGALFGLLPTTSRRPVTVERLGVAELRPVTDARAGGLFGPVPTWRVAQVEIGGVTVGTAG